MKLFNFGFKKIMRGDKPVFDTKKKCDRRKKQESKNGKDLKRKSKKVKRKLRLLKNLLLTNNQRKGKTTNKGKKWLRRDFQH